MMLLILAIVIALVAWALRLMEQAIEGQEFSLMLAGFLVASSAAAMMGVYFLMGNYLVYINQMPRVEQTAVPTDTALADWSEDVPGWLVQAAYTTPGRLE
ncbi:hypothetical protein [Pseudanabaena sp. FACHB-2040]|uniref:hypothetical protein n=1 Tax=Pseudanabaena sp. FACHB-2040 TaxID=2692859 RepID=UPI001684E33F|nr:hypothetical protein [Pseudanabaena sp. FACHB-2040]MBD2260150.1 hypothetical protein [Pseudanabaena sp. FACHB-2040]